MAGSIPNKQSPFVKSFSCRNCRAAVTIHNVRDSVVAICNSCHSTIDLTDPNYKILIHSREKAKFHLCIPLGSRGKLNGILWEVIGYLRRLDVGSNFGWDEFLLFNPYQGYRWLTQAKGHWNFVTPIKQNPIPSSQMFHVNHLYYTYQKNPYKLFYSGQARVVAVLGEFYWRVQTGDTVEVQDFICPPKMLSVEKDKSEQSWSVSEYIEPNLVQEAFKSPMSFPRVMGVAPNQPSKPAQQWKKVQKETFILYGLIILLQFQHVLFSANTTVVQYSDTYPGHTKTVVTQPFNLEQGLSNLTIALQAPVSGTWLAVEGDIVNEKTGETFPFNETVEHYQGYDEGEAWQEGHSRQEELYSSLPQGTYHLDYNVTAAGPVDTSRYVQVAPDMSYALVLKRSVPMWSNFWWVFFLLMIYPAWCWFRTYSFEINRWADSDYSPYHE